MAFNLTFETRITTILMFLTLMLVIEGAYPMWREGNPGFFYYSLGASLLVSIGTAVYLIWRDERGNENQITPPPTVPESRERASEAATQMKSVEQIKLELDVDTLYLTGIGLAFTVESVFIGLYGKSLLGDVIDLQFGQIAAISFMFIGLMIFLWFDYKKKLKEVAAAFRR